MILVPNIWKAFKSTTDHTVRYNVILSRDVIDIHCYYCGEPLCYRWAWPEPVSPEQAEGVFRVVRTPAYPMQRLMRDESKKLADYLVPTVDYSELERLLGVPRKEW